MKFLIYGVFIFIALIIIILSFWSYPWSIKEKKVAGRIFSLSDESTDHENKHVLKLLTWNLGFLFGEGSQGPGYEPKPREFYLNKLSKLAQEIKNADVDIVFLQEVDFASERSHYINQAQTVAELAGFQYVAEATSWDLNYVPFPYWPVSRQFGKMNSGGAVLSKFPILKNEVHLLNKPDSHPWWYNLFYLHRYFQKVEIEINDRIYHFVNLHLESFNKENRMEQVKSLISLIEKESIDLVAGDFNMLHTSATQKANFLNSTDSYLDDHSYDLMLKSGMSEVIPDSIYSKDEATYFTYPSSRPNRRLDYVWFKHEYKMIKAEVLTSALSDHLPIKTIIQIAEPTFNRYSQ